MTSLIPINRVHLNYEPSTAAFTATHYYGSLVGVPKELHDLTCKGHFIPADEDTNLNLSLAGYSKASRDFWITLSDLDTLSDGDSLSLSLNDSFGNLIDYTVVANVSGNMDTIEDLLIRLNDLINAEVNPSVVSEYLDEVITITAINYKTNNAAVSSAVFTITSGLINSSADSTVHSNSDGLIIANDSYPNLGPSSVVLTDTVKIVSKNSKFFSAKILNSPSDTTYRLLPIKANAAIITKRKSTTPKILDTVSHNYTGSEDIVRTYNVGYMIEPGSLKIKVTEASSGQYVYITDFASDVSEEISINTSTGLIPLHVHGDFTGFTNITGISLAGSSIDYISGTINFEAQIAGAADTLSIHSECFILEQVKKDSPVFNTLNDLQINDIAGVGEMIPTLGRDKTINNSSFGGSSFPSVAGTHTYTIGTPSTTGTAFIDSKTMLHFWVDGEKHTVLKSGGSLAADSLIAASSFTDNMPTTDFSVTFAAGVKVDGMILETQWNPDIAELDSHSTFRYFSERSSLENRQTFESESFIANRNEKGATFSRIKTVSTCKFGSEILEDVIYFTTPIFKQVAGSGINFHTAAEFVFVSNERNFSRVLLDNYARATGPGDPIQIEESDINTIGQITFLEGADEFAIKVKTFEREDTLVIKPNVTLSNFISGDIYVEYEAEIRSAATINKLIKIDPNSNLDLVYAKIGHPDPRNTLGFGVHLANKIASTSIFYALPITSESTGLAEGLKSLSFFRDILHVAVLTDEYDGTLDNWIDINNPKGENNPNQSRFRLGYIPHELVDTWYKMGTEGAFQLIANGTLTETDGSKISFSTTDEDVNFLDESVDPGDYFTFEGSDINYLVSEVFEQELIFEDVATVFNSTPVEGIKIYRELSKDEQAQRMYDIQSSDNSYLVKTLMEEVDYSYDHALTGEEQLTQLGREFGPIFPFSMKISSPPHQPLSYIEFTGFGFGEVAKSAGYFGIEAFEKLVSAGYLVLTNYQGSAPYIIRDVTCGIKVGGIEIQGILSKIDPVLHYANDIWYATRPYIGRYNVTDDVKQAIALGLAALREHYVSTSYRYLGTLLREATPAVITEVPNGLSISYKVRPQDVLVFIDNYITVVDA